MSFNYAISGTPFYIGTAAKKNDETKPDTSHMFNGYIMEILLKSMNYYNEVNALSQWYMFYTSTCFENPFVEITPT